MYRNRIEIGGVFAGLVAIVMLFIMPMRYKLERIIVTENNTVKTVLEKFVNECTCEKVINVEKFNELLNSLGMLSTPYIVKIMLGSRIYFDSTTGEKSLYAYETIYTNRLIERLLDEGNIVLNENDAFYVSAQRENTSVFNKLVEFLFASDKQQDEYAVGGLVK